MRIRLLLPGAVVLGVGVLAQALPAATQIGARVLAATAQSATPAVTTLRMRGTIEKYDPSTRILSLSTSNGTLQFQLASTTRIRQGWRKRDSGELEKLAGYRVTVRYSESATNRILESIDVFGKTGG